MLASVVADADRPVGSATVTAPAARAPVAKAAVARADTGAAAVLADADHVDMDALACSIGCTSATVRDAAAIAAPVAKDMFASARATLVTAPAAAVAVADTSKVGQPKRTTRPSNRMTHRHKWLRLHS